MNHEEMCHHIKNDHGLCGKNEFKCMRCQFTFGDFSVFKRHLRICERVPLEDDDDELDGNFVFKE